MSVDRARTVLLYIVAGGALAGVLSAAALGLAVELLRRGLLRLVPGGRA